MLQIETKSKAIIKALSYTGLTMQHLISPRKLDRIPEPFALTEQASNVDEYSKAFDSVMRLPYILALDTVHRVLGSEQGASRKAADLCCGPGHFTRMLVQHLNFAQVTGVDLSQPMLNIARQNAQRRTHATFGRIDTWVNNAGVTIYGKLREVPLHEKRRLFDVNFWGVVHGCRSAVKALSKDGGAIINIGSVLSERAIPIQGIYSASKHAVKAYTDSLRMELEAEGLPISVSLIKPAAIDTPYTEHAKNYMDHKPVHMAPVYSPEIVAKAILECAVTPKRDVFVGGSAKVFTFLETFMPRFADLLMERQMMESGQSDESLDYLRQEPALNRHPSREGRMRGTYQGKVFNRSVTTAATLHPVSAAFISTGLGLAAAAGIGFFMSRSGREVASSMRTGFFAPFGRDLMSIFRRDQRTSATTGYRGAVGYDRTSYFDEPVRH